MFQISLIALSILFFLFKLFLTLAHFVLTLYVNLAELIGKVFLSFKMVHFFQDQKKKKVVIVGGGYAGVYAAKKLERKFQVTMIDTKDYFEFTPSRLRTLVEPWHTHKIHLPHSSILQHTKIVSDRVMI